MLGYRGRSNRRDFIGGVALLVMGPMAIEAVAEFVAPLAPKSVDGPLGVILSLVLVALSYAILAVWFWGATVLLVRRARDIGWPSWVGVVGVGGAGAVAYFFAMPIFFALIGVMAGMPGRRERTDSEIRASVFS